MGAAVIAGMDASPVLEFSEHVLDLVAAPVEHPVEGRRVLPVGFWRYAGGDAARNERLSASIISTASLQCPSAGFAGCLASIDPPNGVTQGAERMKTVWWPI